VVIQSFDHASEEQMKQTVVEVMSPDFAVGHVLSLDQLGFDTWPINETGKIMKIRLKDAALQYLKQKDSG